MRKQMDPRAIPAEKAKEFFPQTWGQVKKLSGCAHEDGSGWCLNSDVDGKCGDQVPTEGGNTACGRAL
jgi:hypothetical protein